MNPELRLMLAAYAPAKPQGWFDDDWYYRVPGPEKPPGAKYCDGCQVGADCDNSEACKNMREWKIDLNDWSRRRDQAKEAAWRLAWADNLMDGAERNAFPTHPLLSRESNDHRK